MNLMIQKVSRTFLPLLCKSAELWKPGCRGKKTLKYSAYPRISNVFFRPILLRLLHSRASPPHLCNSHYSDICSIGPAGRSSAFLIMSVISLGFCFAVSRHVGLKAPPAESINLLRYYFFFRNMKRLSN